MRHLYEQRQVDAFVEDGASVVDDVQQQQSGRGFLFRTLLVDDGLELTVEQRVGESQLLFSVRGAQRPQGSSPTPTSLQVSIENMGLYEDLSSAGDATQVTCPCSSLRGLLPGLCASEPLPSGRPHVRRPGKPSSGVCSQQQQGPHGQ